MGQNRVPNNQCMYGTQNMPEVAGQMNDNKLEKNN